MTVAEYFVDFFVSNGVTDVFGYQGGMIAYLFDSLGKRKKEINYHACATEQGASLAACGYAQASGKVGVVISTSGPGFTNLLTGIANAWFDSIPLICICGQVNTKDKRRSLSVRQLGFQEIQAPEIAAPITKKVYEVDVDTDIEKCLVQAWLTAIDQRKGPVLIELPINICRNIMPAKKALHVSSKEYTCHIEALSYCYSELSMAKKPLIIAGAGICQANLRDEFRELTELLKIPVITTLPAIDLLPTNSPYRLGYLGGTARREAGIALAATDFVLALGTRLCAKQIGYNLKMFAPRAKLFRVDIDKSELEHQIKKDEVQICANLNNFVKKFMSLLHNQEKTMEYSGWLNNCNKMKKLLSETDITLGNIAVHKLTQILPNDFNLTLDVGNNMIYGAQSSIIKEKTRVFVSGGLGTMGYALPAAIGATVGNFQPTCVISGDGGMQMNIQELNIICKKKLPIKIFVLNNRALGHILLFQKAYLNERYYATDERMGDYFSCDFVSIAKAYGISAYKLKNSEDISNYETELKNDQPVLFEFEYENCSLLPNIHGGLDCLTSEPPLKKELISQIMNLGFPLLKPV